MAEHFSFDARGHSLTALVYRPRKPIGITLLFGPGTRGGQRDRPIVELATEVAHRGVLVVTYDFPFIAFSRRHPDSRDVLEASCRAAIVAAMQCRPASPLFVGGRSLGGRIACDVVAEGGEQTASVQGVVVVGYPLHAVGRSDAPQWGRLRDVPVPVLMVQGARDVFGTPELLRSGLSALPTKSQIYEVAGADHSLAVASGANLIEEDVYEKMYDEIVVWMQGIVHADAARQGPRPHRHRIDARLGQQLRSLRRSIRP